MVTLVYLELAGVKINVGRRSSVLIPRVLCSGGRRPSIQEPLYWRGVTQINFSSTLPHFPVVMPAGTTRLSWLVPQPGETPPFSSAAQLSRCSRGPAVNVLAPSELATPSRTS